MALAQGRGGAYEHKFMCSTPVRRQKRFPDSHHLFGMRNSHNKRLPSLQHAKGHWCWTNAEIESLKSQAAQNREWSTIAKVSQLSIVLLVIWHPGFHLSNKDWTTPDPSIDNRPSPSMALCATTHTSASRSGGMTLGTPMSRSPGQPSKLRTRSRVLNDNNFGQGH